MPYREVPRIPEHVRQDEPDPALRRFDVSGRKGADGRHGAPGADGASAGAHGHRGGDAGAAEPGQSAGTINLTLATAEVDGMARLTGTLMPPASENSGESAAAMHSIDEVLTFGQRGFIELDALGGQGGRGGDGGPGGDGARGRGGRDATRFSSGSDGGPGGDGGDGGNATSGAPGGRGGDITLIVDVADTQLLMLVEHDIAGGSGGAPGSNAMGGSGGAGGSGGSSYSWTESESYTDSQGNTQTRTRYRSNPGGSRGPSGMSGMPGDARAQRGQNGSAGSFAIEVKSEDGVHTYPSRYDLRLVSFAHESANQDCVYEPQETVRVFDIEVENTGGMPTPAHRDIELSLVRQGWVAPRDGDDERLLLPRALNAGERCTVDGALHFIIGDWKPHGPDDPLELEEVIGHRARLPAVYRDFGGYEHDASREMGQFVIRFPVRAEPIVSLCSLAPGQAARMRWSVINQSLAGLGAGSGSGRVVRVRLGLDDSEIGDEHLICCDDQGQELLLAEGLCRDIDVLEPGGRADFEILLGLRPSAPHYRGVSVRLSLELGYLDQPAQARPVQYRAFTTRVSRPYQADDNADLLLVVNHKTTGEALAAWQELARSMGFTLNTWDLSYERHLDLRAPRGGETLIEQFRGKTIVICDNAVDHAGSVDGDGDSAHAHWLVAKDDLFAAVAGGVSVAFLGRGMDDMRAQLVPTHDDQDAARPGTGASPDELITALARTRSERDTALERVHQSVDVRTRLRLWGQPLITHLTAQARWLAKRLRDEHPDRRYIVVYDYRPEVVGRWLWMKRWRLGELMVRGTIDTAAGVLVHERMHDHEVHDPQRIQAAGTIMTLLLTRSLDEKLARLDALLRKAEVDGDRIALVVDAICVDIANEQHAVMISGWRSGLSASELMRSLSLLRRLAGFRWSAGDGDPPPLDSPWGQALVRMFARLSFLFDTQARWWEWPLYPWRRGPCLRRTSKRLLDPLIDSVFGHEFGDESGDSDAMRRARRKQARRRIKAEVKILRHQVRDARRTSPVLRHPGAYSRALLRAPLERDGVTTDAELLTELDSRILSREEYDELCARDQAALERRARLMRDQAHAHADLLVGDRAPGHGGR